MNEALGVQGFKEVRDVWRSSERYNRYTCVPVAMNDREWEEGPSTAELESGRHGQQNRASTVT